MFKRDDYSEMVEGNISRFIWLRKIEIGDNSAMANRLLDRLEFLQNLALDPQVLAGVPPHRVAETIERAMSALVEGEG